MEGSASLTPNQPEGLDKWTESSVWGSLPLTRKAPYKVKNRAAPPAIGPRSAIAAGASVTDEGAGWGRILFLKGMRVML
jgi:hypothetical protein